jgi:hypothetical protein
MKRILLALALACSTAFAADTKPTEASIKELLALTDAAKLIDSIWAQVDGMTQNMLAQSTRGQELPAEAKAVIEKLRTDSMALAREEFSWAKMEVIYNKIYQDSFTQEELDGMIAFYKTPAGQAVIKKMPVVMQASMQELQKSMGPFMQKLQQLQLQAMTELKAIEQAKAAPAPAAEPAAAPAK